MNRKDRRAAEKRGGPATSPTAPTLASAFHAHQAGHRAEAERMYRDVLAIEPRNAAALHLLGALAHQSGRSAEAVSLMSQAVAIDPRNADYHYNLGSTLQSTGRLPEAAAHYEKAIALKPNHAEALFELGNVRARLQSWSDAAASFKRVLALKPNDAATLNNLGMVLREQGKLDEAMTLWQRAVTAMPSFYLAHMNVGLAHKTKNNNAEAFASLTKALELKPDAPDVIYNLSAVLMDQARHVDAMRMILRGLEKSATPELRALFVACLHAMPQMPAEERIHDLIAQAMAECWSRPEQLSAAAAVFLKGNPVIGSAIALVNKHWPRPVPVQELIGPGGPGVLAQDKLLIAALESAPITDFDLERFLTGLRFALLAGARQNSDAPVDESVLRLTCALARQCFINGYVFTQSEDEANRVRELRTAIASALQGSRPVPPQWLPAVAAYAPLHDMPGAQLLAKQQWPESVQRVIEQQIQEPAEERTLTPSVVVLTDLENEDALSNNAAGPRWTGLPANHRPLSIDAYLRRVLPHAAFIDLAKSGPLDSLVAGCGTGQTAIEIAQRHPSPDVLAVDASRDNLAYAQRQARRLAITNVSFAEADSARLSSLGRTFDVIDATGALRTMADAQGGLRALAAMLRPRGFMLISVESARMRQAFDAARDFARNGNYQPDEEGIRLIRQNIMRLPQEAGARLLLRRGEFCTMQACRELFFDRQEQPLTLAALDPLLIGAGLKLIGVDADSRVRDRYAKTFPHDRSMTDLANWQTLENAEPDFSIMTYRLWVQNIAGETNQVMNS